MTLEQFTRKEELKRQMDETEQMYDANVLTWRERTDLYLKLNDEFKMLTGNFYTTGRRAIDPITTSVHHDRAYLHLR